MGNCANKGSDDDQGGLGHDASTQGRKPSKGFSPRVGVIKPYKADEEAPATIAISVEAKPETGGGGGGGAAAATPQPSRKETRKTLPSLPDPAPVSGELDLCYNRGPNEEEY